MNKRIKKKKRNQYLTGTAKTRKYNKWLCQRYPFLIPRSVWTDKVMWSRDKYYAKVHGHKDYNQFKKFSYTLAEDFMPGWWKAFGLMFCEELRKDLIKCNYLYKFRFVQIKEKYAGLRAYCNGAPMESKVFEIIDKYEFISNYVCEYCGAPDTAQINNYGWLMTICEDCYNKMKKYDKQIPYAEKLDENKDCTIPNKRIVKRYSKGGDETIEYDISETVNAIRNNWRGR